MFSLAVFVSAMLDPRPSRSGAAAGRAHSDDGCDHLSYARARPHTIGSSQLPGVADYHHARQQGKSKLGHYLWGPETGLGANSKGKSS